MNAQRLPHPRHSAGRWTFLWILIAMMLYGFAVMLKAYDHESFDRVYNAIRYFFRFCHEMYEEYKYYEWATALFGFFGALGGLGLHYKWQTWKRNRRVNARRATFKEIQHLIQEQDAKVVSLGMTTKSRTGISTFHLLVGPGNPANDFLVAIEVDTKNAPALSAGQYPVVDYRHDCVIFWLKTDHGLVPKVFNL